MKDCNAKILPLLKGLCVHQLFEKQVVETPDATAVIFDDGILTYTELNSRANQLAHALIALGVDADVPVAIALERSPEVIIALLAILKAGGVYVPIDPDYPAGRLAFMLEDSGARIVITRESLRKRLPQILEHTLCFDGEWISVTANPDNNPKRIVSQGSLAYVIYTSGSTGKPKGVAVEHRSIVQHCQTIEACYELTPQDHVLQFASLSFDASLEQILPTLCAGAAIVLPLSSLLSPDNLNECIRTKGVTVMELPPAFFQLWSSSCEDGISSMLRLIILGGDVVAPGILTIRKGWSKPWPRLLNSYGPTEATIATTCYDIPEDQSGIIVPIGRPLPHQTVYVLDKHLQQKPIGVPGELHIGGHSLARGYLNQPELTLEKFIPDPFSHEPGARLYKTGDLVRYRSDGNLEFLGRLDNQVKIRGFRIELGEIEATLVTHPAIREAVVIARSEEYGEKRLVAYIVEANSLDKHESVLTNRELRFFLKASLPDYMLPAAFVFLAALPLTINGKIDRKALPEPIIEASTTSVEPHDELEEFLVALWGTLLHQVNPSIHDNFFELGGHSLLAIKLVSSLRDDLGIGIPVRWIFETPTVFELAERIRSFNRSDESVVSIPPNRILPGTTLITPDLLPLVTLSQTEIEQVVLTVDGGTGNIQDIYPLAPLQEGILFHHHLQSIGDTYLNYTLFAVDTFVRCEAFISAFQLVVDRHDILRTAIVWQELPDPVQVVWRHVVLPVEIRHFDAIAGPIAHQLVEAFHPRHTRLDLSKPPLLRIVLAEDGEHWLMLFLSHHLIIDQTTIDIIFKEIALIMEGKLEQLAPQIPFRDFICEARGGSTNESHSAYFCDMLKDIETTTAPFGLLDVRGDGSTIVEAHRNILPELAVRIRTAARHMSVTPAALCHLAWAIFLSRCCNQSEVVFGTVLFGRLQGGSGFESALGLFINTLPFRVTCDADPVAVALRKTQQSLLLLMCHEHATLGLTQRCSAIPAGMPLFSSLLNYRHSTEFDNTTLPFEGIELLKTEGRTNYPLSLSIDDFGEGFSLTAKVDETINPERICSFMVCALESLVTALEKKPQTPLFELDILPHAERNQLLVEWNPAASTLPKDRCVHELFEEQAALRPNAAAVVFEDEILTYAELNARANQLAYTLRTRGVKADEAVAVALDRSPEVVIALLAILKAGGVYLPLDPDYPFDRLRFMLEDSGAQIMITKETLRERLPFKVKHTICLDTVQEFLTIQLDSNPNFHVSAKDLAYVIYTSGSTGKPKGVAVEHRSIALHCHTVKACFELTPQDRVLQFASLSFDSSLAQMLPPLSAGAAIILPQPRLHSPEKLDACLRKQGVTVMHLTPSFFSLWSLSCQGNLAPSLRLINSGGDVLPPGSLKVCESWYRPGLRLVNSYGPTEATITATMYDIPKGLTGPYVPIGRPLLHRTVYVLDKQLQPTPIGVAGELHIGGPCLARGYLNQSELTAEKFISDPFSSEPGARLYKTGDLVRYRSDGNLEFLGRLDNQVKIRGFRIELGEIETALRSHSNISDAIVMRWEDEPGLEKLVAYVVGQNDLKASQEELRTFLRSTLPHFMIPSVFVVLEKMPLTPNGKINRNALPHPGTTVLKKTAYTAPRDTVEKQLVEIWEEVLGVHPIGIYDNFFDIGGHSLLAVKLLLKIQNKITKEITLSNLYQALTIKKLARQIVEDTWQHEILSMVSIQPGNYQKAILPLFFIHVLGIGLKFCKPIVKYLGSDIPVYGLSIQLLDKKPQVGNRVEDLARFYNREVKKIQPEGPYMFTGFSFGGLVAFEMARQMKESGEDVRLVALLESILPKMLKKTTLTRRVTEYYKNWKRQGTYSVMRQGLQRLYYSWREKIEHCFFRKILWYYKLVGFSGDISIDLKEFVAWSENHEAAQHYNPYAYTGKVILFKSDHTQLDVEYSEDPQLGWGGVVLGGVEIIKCHGDHIGMLADPNVETVAKKLRQSIDRALHP